MSVVVDTLKKETLAQHVAKTMRDKGLTAREVERLSGGKITHSYVNKIKNGDARNPSLPLLQALAKGLAVTEEKIFSLVRGLPPEGQKINHAKLASIDFTYEEMPPPNVNASNR